jgi:hypothetical protein
VYWGVAGQGTLQVTLRAVSSVQDILSPTFRNPRRHANVTTAMNLYVKMVSADAVNAIMRTQKPLVELLATRDSRGFCE